MSMLLGKKPYKGEARKFAREWGTKWKRVQGSHIGSLESIHHPSICFVTNEETGVLAVFTSYNRKGLMSVIHASGNLPTAAAYTHRSDDYVADYIQLNELLKEVGHTDSDNMPPLTAQCPTPLSCKS